MNGATVMQATFCSASVYLVASCCVLLLIGIVEFVVQVTLVRSVGLYWKSWIVFLVTVACRSAS